MEPATVHEVAQVLGTVVKSWCTFAIKGGGHSRAVNASNSKSGVAVYMSHFNSFQVSDDRESGWICAGLTLLPSYRAAETEGLSFIGDGRYGSIRGLW